MIRWSRLKIQGPTGASTWRQQHRLKEHVLGLWFKIWGVILAFPTEIMEKMESHQTQARVVSSSHVQYIFTQLGCKQSCLRHRGIHQAPATCAVEPRFWARPFSLHLLSPWPAKHGEPHILGRSSDGMWGIPPTLRMRHLDSEIPMPGFSGVSSN